MENNNDNNNTKKKQIPVRSNFEKKIKDVRELIKEIEEKRESTCLVFFCLGSIELLKVYEVLNIIRKEKDIENLDLILESGGGQLDAAAKIAHLCQDFSKKFSVFIPYYAKSAATLIALNADELILCRAGELGPIDPQVKHPVLDIYLPASSIKNALEFIESSNDPYIKMIMADKLDPLLIGAYNQAFEEAKKYLEEVPKIKNANNRKEIINTFTKKYIDHGYPITHRICEELNLCESYNLDREFENLLYDIHQILLKLMLSNDIDIIILTKNQLHCAKNCKEESMET